MARLVGRELQCPWLVAASATLCKKDRRKARVRAKPVVEGAEYYRYDGASRAQGRGGAGEAGWGAAWWAAGADGRGEPDATATGYLGNGVSNNISEYSGMRACLMHAVRRTRRNRARGVIVVQGDSTLTTKQMRGEMGCRSEALRHIFAECCRLATEIREAGLDLRFEHTYREFNTVADALSNEAVDRREQSGPSDAWLTSCAGT